MKRLGKRFIALLVAFASIVSFLPIEFLSNVQSVNAAISNSSTDINAASTIHVSEANSKTEIKPTKDDVDKNLDVYSTDEAPSSGGFDIFLDKVYVDKSDLEEEALRLAEAGKKSDGTYSQSSYKSETRIVGQEVTIKYINGLDADTTDGIDRDKASIESIDVTIEDCNQVQGSGGKERIGKTIKNLPLGVNKIQYEVKIKTQSVSYNPITNEYTPSDIKEMKYTPELMINNARNYVIKKIDPLTFYQFIGANDKSELENNKENNAAPFLYEAEAEADTEIPLRYTWYVPDSLQALTYNMKFSFKISEGSNVRVFKNGYEQTGTKIVDNAISGSLSKIQSSELIVVKINGSGFEDGQSGPIDKLYSIELRYPTKTPNEDYSLSSAGITKYQYNENKDVKAFIGKEFKVTKETSSDGDVIKYEGKIYIDPKVELISFNPTLIAQSKVNLTYKLSLNYVKDGKTYTDSNIEIIDNKQFIPFNEGERNTLVLEVYNEKGKVVCRYFLDVEKPDTASEYFDMSLKFDGNTNADTFLTAEGAAYKKEDAVNKKINFSKDRPNYDLYTARDGVVDIGLVKTTETHEYIKVYLSDSINGANPKEAQESVENTFSEVSGVRDSELSINYGTAKSIVVQAYYDEVEPYEDENGETKYRIKESSTVGRKYTFNIPANIKQTDNNNNSQLSKDALLSNIKIKGETLYDLDGKKGFTSDNFDYEVKVDKNKKNALLTVVPEDENVKSMVATVTETGDTYDLYSGEETDITLNEAGTTTLNIEVTAQDGKATQAYTVTIINNTKGGNSKLKNVILSTGDYTFDPSEYETKVYVDQSVNKLSITPVAEDSKAKITVDGQKYNNTAITISLTGSQKKEIDIVVTSEDGNNKTTYTLKVKRVTSFPDDDDDDHGKEDDSYYDYDNDIWIDNSKYDEWGTTSDGRVVYYDTNGRQVKDKWIVTNDKYYYINKSGYRATGWKIDSDGKTYYLDPKTGEMKTGWIYVDGSTYYLNPRGIMQKGWLNLNNKWYYFTSNGQMVSNTSMYIDGRLYKFAQDGVMYY